MRPHMWKQTLLTTISCCLTIHFAYSISQELLASRDNLSASLLCAPSQRNESLVMLFAGARRTSDNKQAECVFTGGDDVQCFFFPSGMCVTLTVRSKRMSLAYCRFAKAIGLNQTNALGCCDEPATSFKCGAVSDKCP